MAHGHSIKSDFTLGGTSFKADLSSVRLTMDRQYAEFRALGAEQVEYLPGHKLGSIAVEGAYEPALDAALYAAWDGGTSVAWEDFPQGSSQGNVKYSGTVYVRNVQIGQGGDAVTITAELIAASAIERGTVN